MSALDRDPLRAVWDALEAHGCDPHGRDHDYRARCPAHDGDGRDSLHVWEGSDGRAMVHCFPRNCEPREIVRAVGLGMGDLFPPGHDLGRKLPGVGKPDRFVDRVLGQLRALRVPYRATADPGFWVALCPACSRKAALWIFEDDRRRVTLSCAGGCEQFDVLRALAGEATA